MSARLSSGNDELGRIGLIETIFCNDLQGVAGADVLEVSVAVRKQFSVLLDEFEETVKRSTELADDLVHDHRKEGIARRRKTTELVTQLGQWGDELFTGDPMRKTFQSVFARMRSSRALHQASWPVVCIDRDDPRYIESLQSTRNATRSFITWARQELDRIGKSERA